MKDPAFGRVIRSSRRAIVWGIAAGVGVFVLFGLVTGLIPNPIYVRMVPRTPPDYLFLALTAILAGVYTAHRVGTAAAEGCRLDAGNGTGSTDNWALGGLAGGFLAVGCPICNVFLLALFSSSALLTYFDPLRPVLGLVSVGLLAGLLYVRHQRVCSTGGSDV